MAKPSPVAGPGLLTATAASPRQRPASVHTVLSAARAQTLADSRITQQHLQSEPASLWLAPRGIVVRAHNALARQSLALPDYRGPLIMLLGGLLAALLATPGPWPSLLTLASLVLAYGVYRLARALAERGRFAWGAAVIIAFALIAVPLAFGPDPVIHRKVTPLNAWAYDLGAHLPAIVLPAPNPNAIAGLLAIALSLAAAMALYRHGWRRWLAAGAAVLAGASLIITASRTGWLAGAAALCVVAASGHGRRWALLALGIAGPAIAVLMFVAPTLRSPADLAIRNSLWEATINLLSRHPVTGLGISRLRAAGIIAQSAYGRAALITPHNALLQLWADGGVLGVAGLAWLLARMGKTVLALSSERHPAIAWAAAGVNGALIAFAVQGLCETNTMFVWQSGAVFHEMLSPLPLALLGFLAGLQRWRIRLAEEEKQRSLRERRSAYRSASKTKQAELARVAIVARSESRGLHS